MLLFLIFSLTFIAIDTSKARGYADWTRFFNELATTHRVFHIKITEINLLDMDGRSNFSCITCILNDKNDEIDESEVQMSRFDTQVSK